MSIFDRFKSDPAARAAAAHAAARHADVLSGLSDHTVPQFIRSRLEGARAGTLPWIATMSPAELRVTRSHGLIPVAAVTATCCLHYGWSWTYSHAEGWESALRRLRQEAVAAGANAIVDVKMRSLHLGLGKCMDFTLIGTAVRCETLPASAEPVVATLPCLELVKMLEADVVPTGIAIGANHGFYTESIYDTNLWGSYAESAQLRQLWETTWQGAHAQLMESARQQGNGVLAHVHLHQLFRLETERDQPKQYTARHIVIGTTVDVEPGAAIPHEIKIVVDVHAGRSSLQGSVRHHQSYGSRDREEGI